MPCYLQVRLQDINLDDRSYSLNPFPEDFKQDLVQSICELGILQPPLLLEQQDGYIILSGRKRIEAYLQLCNNRLESSQQKNSNDQKITALSITTALEKEEGYPLHLFKVLLEHQLLGNRLTLIEQAVFLKKAAKVLDKQDLVSFLPLFGLKTKPHIPGEIISLLDLEVSVQQGMHKGIISQRSGKKLARFSPDDQKKLAEIIYEYQLGGSKQQKLLERFFQLTKRKKITTERLLDLWKETVKEKQLNGPQRSTSLLRWLDQQYHPRLARAEGEFRTFSSQLQLPAGLRLEHSPAFEEEQITLSIDFKSKEELAHVWPQIKILIKKDKEE